MPGGEITAVGAEAVQPGIAHAPGPELVDFLVIETRRTEIAPSRNRRAYRVRVGSKLVAMTSRGRWMTLPAGLRSGSASAAIARSRSESRRAADPVPGGSPSSSFAAWLTALRVSNRWPCRRLNSPFLACAV